MIKRSELRVETEVKHLQQIDLSKLVGKAIKSVVCDSTQEFGLDATLQIVAIIFDDDSFMWVEGEHDFPYLVSDGPDDQPNCHQETLNELAEEVYNDD